MIHKKEIIDNIFTHQQQFQKPILLTWRDKEVFAKVMSLYFQYMYDALIKGLPWHIHRFGDLIIEEQRHDHRTMRFTPKYYKGEVFLRNKRVYNTRTVGSIFCLVIKSEHLEKFKCRFKSSLNFRRRMNKVLKETGKLEEYVD